MDRDTRKVMVEGYQPSKTVASSSPNGQRDARTGQFMEIRPGKGVPPRPPKTTSSIVLPKKQ